MFPSELHRRAAEQAKLAASRGFTIEYQAQQEATENTVAQPELARPTEEKHIRVAENWAM